MTPQHELSPSEVKIALKQAIKEWLDEKFAEFGWFSAKTLMALLLAALAAFILHQNGWHKGP